MCNKVYCGVYDSDSGERQVLVFVNEGMPSEECVPLDPAASQEIINHSPTGFNWGYGGSGPAQLALALLLDATGDKDRSVRFYQTFKWDQVSNLPNNWKLTETSILNWLSERENGQ